MTLNMVSIIIPVHNYARYLMDAVFSVAYEISDCEIIIVDDGSTDDINNVVNDIMRPYNFAEISLTYVPLVKNHGVSYARNMGLILSFGEYITFLDADDMRTPGSIMLQKNYLDEHDQIDVVWGKALEVRGDVRYYEACQKIRDLRIHPSEVNPQTVMYRRSVFERFGGWYESLTSGEDKEMSMRLGIHPDSPFNHVKAHKLNSKIAFYRKHPEEKHKKRKADSEWYKETKKIQKRRLKQLKTEGITKGNTRFPI